MSARSDLLFRFNTIQNKRLIESDFASCFNGSAKDLMRVYLIGHASPRHVTLPTFYYLIRYPKMLFFIYFMQIFKKNETSTIPDSAAQF
jgi:hypothetical protein